MGKAKSKTPRFLSFSLVHREFDICNKISIFHERPQFQLKAFAKNQRPQCFSFNSSWTDFP